MENIKYGNLETAMEYCKRNRTEEWIQQFLRCDGHNVALPPLANWSSSETLGSFSSGES